MFVDELRIVWMWRGFLGLSCLALLLVGCSAKQKQMAANQNVALSPLEEFKIRVSCLDDQNTWGAIQNVKYDVQQTNSLVAPIIGVVTFERYMASSKDNGDEKFGDLFFWRVELAYEETRWAVRKVSFRSDPALKRAVNRAVARLTKNSNVDDAKDPWKEEPAGTNGFTNIESELGFGSGKWKFDSKTLKADSRH